MSDPTLAKTLREIGFAEALQPARSLRHIEAVKEVINETRDINPAAASPFRTPLTLHWASGSTARPRVARAGTLAVVAAYAGTAPSTGDAKITVTSTSQYSGTDTLYVLTIPDGTKFAEESIAVPVSAGARLGATVTTANGAAAVDIDVVINQGGA